MIETRGCTPIAVGILGVVAYEPSRVESNISVNNQDSFFQGVTHRHLAGPGESADAMAQIVARHLVDALGVESERIGLLICTAQYGRHLSPGVAAAVCAELRMADLRVVNMDNGCMSWITALGMASDHIQLHPQQLALVVNVTHFVSRTGQFANSPAASVLGEGAAATLIGAGGGLQIGAVVERAAGERYAGLAIVRTGGLTQDLIGDDWVQGLGVEFNPQLLATVQRVAVRDVPAAIQAALDSCQLQANDIDLFITHQPNRSFIQRWQSMFQISAERGFDTLAKHGNMFAVNLPFVLACALQERQMAPGLVVLSSFSNSGEAYGAVVLRKARHAQAVYADTISA